MKLLFIDNERTPPVSSVVRQLLPDRHQSVLSDGWALAAMLLLSTIVANFM
jgi:hypothetical protein